ncbi:MAG: GyrI-like domain-containing protein [Chlamydia sp.]
MQRVVELRSELKLVGITTRTSNAQLFENGSATNPITNTIQKYFQENLPEKIKNRKNPGTTLCVYTDYESDFQGAYTYFIGAAVICFDDVDKEFETLTIPAQNYAKFTNQPGPMPHVCVDMWKKIWNIDEGALGGKRAYIADFEMYDERSADFNNAVLDIYIGIK